MRGEACGEGHTVLLGDADVERAIGMRLGELVDPGAARHRRRDRADPVIGFRKLGQGFTEHVLVGRRPAAAVRRRETFWTTRLARLRRPRYSADDTIRAR